VFSVANYEQNKKHILKHMEKLDRIYLTVPEGTKEEWQKVAQEKGRSLNRFIIDCVEAVGDDLLPLPTPTKFYKLTEENVTLKD